MKKIRLGIRIMIRLMAVRLAVFRANWGFVEDLANAAVIATVKVMVKIILNLMSHRATKYARYITLLTPNVLIFTKKNTQMLWPMPNNLVVFSISAILPLMKKSISKFQANIATVVLAQTIIRIMWE